MRLIDAETGTSYAIREIGLRKETARRLEMLGMTRGARLKVLGKKRSGTMIIRVRGTKLALGGSFAEGIAVEEPTEKCTS